MTLEHQSNINTTNASLANQLFQFDKARVLVIGDVMLDQYWHGETSRISPEAPVPVVHVQHVEERPGGAANVALNIAALGAHPFLLGLTGCDSYAKSLKHLLSAARIPYQLHEAPDYETIVKLRVLSHHQQMIRIDREKNFAPIFSQFSWLEEQYRQALENTDIVLLSDYGKGSLSKSAHLIAEARAKRIPVIVDPKSSDYAHYRGASIITPNLKEFEAVVGPCQTPEDMVEKARGLLARYDIETLVITRSEHGLSIVTKQDAVHIASVAREVHDVTGAGDTVIAVLASALASGVKLVQAATLGNIAAGIAVGKLGTATVSTQELQTALHEQHTQPYGVVDEKTLLNAIQQAKAKGERIVFTNGCFDIVHSGHVMYLEQAKQLGDRVVVAVNDDDSVRRLKGASRPVNTLKDRMQVLAGLRSIDWIVSFSEDTPERLIKLITPDLLVKGGDYRDIMALPGAQFVLETGGDVQILGLQEGYSTTRIIEAITTE